MVRFDQLRTIRMEDPQLERYLKKLVGERMEAEVVKLCRKQFVE